MCCEVQGAEISESNRGLKNLSDVTEASQLVSGKVDIWTQFSETVSWVLHNNPLIFWTDEGNLSRDTLTLSYLEVSM